tara:strand:+ start:834 stop:1232 length:399 start_codon:yes stop_codon:yes gene_type:complete
MKVRVYKNLTKDTWSIQDYKTRKVIGYSENIRLEDAQFVVSEKTRQRVISEGKKYVHAFVVGELVDTWKLTESYETVRYNPYMFGSFFTEPFFDLAGKKYGKYQPVSKDWRGTVHLFRDKDSQKLIVRKEVA